MDEVTLGDAVADGSVAAGPEGLGDGLACGDAGSLGDADSSGVVARSDGEVESGARPADGAESCDVFPARGWVVVPVVAVQVAMTLV